jgi:hypothetical protein
VIEDDDPIRALVNWLHAQLDEEAAEASQGDDLSWHDECCAWVTVTWHGTNEPRRGGPCDCGVPARRLAEIEAKRRLLDWLVERPVHRHRPATACPAVRRPARVPRRVAAVTQADETHLMPPSPDFDRAAADAARLYESTPVTRRSELNRLAEARPDLAARLDDLASRILAEDSRPQREYGEVRGRPSVSSRVAFRFPQTGN